MGSTSLLLVVITALTTWIFSIFVLSSRYHHRLGHDVAHSGSPFGWNPTKSKVLVAPLSAKGDHDHRDEVAPMQGGNGTFKKKLRSYINMTDYAGPSTIWKFYPHEFPCVDGAAEPHMVTTPAHEGILFQRPVKTGSTTITSIILRLIKRYTTTGIDRCKYRAMHATSRELEFGRRNPDKSYLLSVVRDPTLKAISRFFHFDVSIGQKVPTDAYFQMIMGRGYNQNDLTFQLVTRNNTRPLLNATQTVQDILGTCLLSVGSIFREHTKTHVLTPPVPLSLSPTTEDYDFIAVTERMDESLVVWKILFNLDFYDILYIKARSAGTFSNGPGDKGRPCVYLVPSFLTPGMQTFFESKKWKDSNALDILLYQAVYKSLDNTIAAIGKERFQQELNTFRQAQKVAQEFCEGKVIGVCTPGGSLVSETHRTCVVWGEGCDSRCLSDFRRRGGLSKIL